MNKNEIDAYAAGLIDGEGCITIAKYTNNSGNTYSARIDIGMTAKAMGILQWMKRNYGGSIRQCRKGTTHWEEVFAWSVMGKKALKFLQEIHPHLILKAEQARLAIRLQEMIAELPSSKGWTENARERGKIIYIRIQELNRKGPGNNDIEMNGWFARRVGATWVRPQMDMFSDLGWASYLGTWPKQGTMHHGHVYEHPTLERRINGNEYSLWPTPTANDAKNATLPPASGNWDSLPGEIRRQLWRTPQAQDAKSALIQRGYTTNLTHQVAGRLNPDWVEMLMGLPAGWTDIEDMDNEITDGQHDQESNNSTGNHHG